MSVTRKDDHIKYAKSLGHTPNEFSRVRLIHHSIPTLSINDVSLNTTLFNKTFAAPFYINAMTGGNKAGNAINEKLAALANYFNIPFFVGSQSLMYKDAKVRDEYIKLRQAFPDLFIVANVNPNATLSMAKDAVNVLKANALAIHVNSIQELTMAEGDRDFSKWDANIKSIIEGLDVPVIIKEVGYGMHDVTLTKLQALGATYIDISGSGGTNFTTIEMMRSGQTSNVLSEFGRSTVDSLQSAVNNYNFTVFASGGIKSASDIIKALALGARACGMARYFLDLSELSIAQAINNVESLISDLKKIMLLLNVKTLNELNKSHLIL